MHKSIMLRMLETKIQLKKGKYESVSFLGTLNETAIYGQISKLKVSMEAS